MTIPTISTLPTAPARTDAPATFITRADAFLAALVTMQSELNTSIGAMNTDIAQANADATAAAASASAAATSESNASTSETNAATSETNAASSAAAAASSYDQFDDRYLGSKASDPAVDNDGNALLTGALYFNSTSDDMKVYTGSTWKVTGFNPDSPIFTDTVTAPSFDINSIAETKAETAVDVFVYDTRKDSDGGAWRKRTQNTSWYNETLDTATRGSRKEFPAVAVIVAETNQVTIYDGDDPSLPMWMVFNGGGSTESGARLLHINNATKQATAISALNGTISVSALSVGVTIFSMITEISGRSRITGTYIFNGNIQQRNQLIGGYLGDSKSIVNDDVNDVAMTVLPNAPIDAATGLPVPTIAVATDTAISVITDDGTVNDSSYASGIGNVSFSEDYTLLFNRSSAVENLQFSLLSEYTGGDSFNSTIVARTSAAYWPYLPVRSRNTTALSGNSLAIGSTTATGQAVPGMCQIHLNKSDVPNSLFSLHTNSYATGWMNGDIKLATLSDTDDTNIGTQEVTNGTFNTDLTGWTNSGSHWAVSSGRAYHSLSGEFYTLFQALPSLVTGKQYTIKFDYEVIQGELRAQSRTSGNSPATAFTLEITGTGTETLIFTKSADMGGIAFARNTFGVPSEFYIDNVSIVEAVEDRSVNDNGLQVFGNITKDPVATGADLVAYSNFLGTNYLEQPYNSDLDFGTGDFCVMGWVKNPTENNGWFFMRGVPESTDTFGLRELSNNLTANIGAASISTGINLPTDWCHVTIIRNSGTFYAYLNGVNEFSVSNSNDITEPDAVLRFGIKTSAFGNTFGGSLALWRFSATAPTAEQIAKIYEDEKFLFQENAQATLYGSSDAVTALAYDDDTELLHVGTSAGRSVFQGLRRVDNTTGAVGAAISASNGLVAED